MSLTLSEARLNRNHLLARLSDEEYQPLLSKLAIVEHQRKDLLYERGKPVSHVYFPCDAVCSKLVAMENGDTVEVSTVGNEGFNPVEMLLGSTHAAETAVCQIEGKSLCMTADDFREAISGPTPLRRLLERYAQACLSQVVQSAACDLVHRIEGRFARWLLITNDRVQGKEFFLTQEFMAMMLGVDCPTVVAIAAHYHEAGVIQYNRGQIRILDRAKLAEASCECYEATRSRFEQLLGTPYG